MKRTFVVPDEKEAYYDKFKQLVPEVSTELVRFIVEYVDRQEALQTGMVEQTVHEGSYDTAADIFQGSTAKFYGVQLAKGKHTGTEGKSFEVYLTKKGKFLVYRVVTGSNSIQVIGYNTYENYQDMKDKSELSVGVLRDCEKYLSLNSNIRVYEVLDI